MIAGAFECVLRFKRKSISQREVGSLVGRLTTLGVALLAQQLFAMKNKVQDEAFGLASDDLHKHLGKMVR